jgi:hypothetical protein
VKPAAGQPLLLSFDDVTTLFHEFGHALHGMLSRQEYPLFAGTATATDFVEFPSQINEALSTDPVVLANYAKHYSTGEPIPASLIAKMKKADTFNQGYATSEYLAAALLDIEWHTLPADAPLVTDVEAFEKAALEKYGLLDARVPPRYKTVLLQSHLGRWLQRQLLRLHVERSAGSRRLCMVRGERRFRPHERHALCALRYSQKAAAKRVLNSTATSQAAMHAWSRC